MAKVKLNAQRFPGKTLNTAAGEFEVVDGVVDVPDDLALDLAGIPGCSLVAETAPAQPEAPAPAPAPAEVQPPPAPATEPVPAEVTEAVEDVVKAAGVAKSGKRK